MRSLMAVKALYERNVFGNVIFINHLYNYRIVQLLQSGQNHGQRIIFDKIRFTVRKYTFLNNLLFDFVWF